eukprot:TRINITY_DN16719_c0_g4_i3.p3 TRINITY_DN16719_c0_g4~~TRINITY_DN16719_c0_g4_i3.p3  ORF type:complete len:115 (+),score=0.18 TRINITY_DN16719_c0_g4_i3:96-440(+)
MISTKTLNHRHQQYTTALLYHPIFNNQNITHAKQSKLYLPFLRPKLSIMKFYFTYKSSPNKNYVKLRQLKPIVFENQLSKQLLSIQCKYSMNSTQQISNKLPSFKFVIITLFVP